MYTDRKATEGLVNGHYMLGAGLTTPLPAPTWAAIRSKVERTGNLDLEGWDEVLDLERGLRLLASPLVANRRDQKVEMQARRAAMLISARLLLGFDDRELRSLVPRGEDPAMLIRKGCAWIRGYLNGEELVDCEHRFRRQR